MKIIKKKLNFGCAFILFYLFCVEGGWKYIQPNQYVTSKTFDNINANWMYLLNEGEANCLSQHSLKQKGGKYLVLLINIFQKLTGKRLSQPCQRL